MSSRLTRTNRRSERSRTFTLVFALVLVFLIAGCAGAPAIDDNTPPPSPSAATLSGATPSARATASPEVTTGPSPIPVFGSAPVGATEVAIVLSITDGDTIRVDRGFGSEPVRYIGINTPEVGDPGAAEATADNTRLLEGMHVVLEKDVSETDQFDRLLRYIWVERAGAWVFVNYELVRGGLAQASTYPPDVRFTDYFLEAQRDARDDGSGLWAPTAAPTVAPTPPPLPDPTEPPPPPPAPANCHPSYVPCLPVVDDLNCPDVRALGKAPVQVVGPDDYRLDSDSDGVGCE